MGEKHYVKICPMCGSIDLERIGPSKSGTMGYRCPGCGWNKLFPEVLDSKIDEFREELRRLKGQNQGRF